MDLTNNERGRSIGTANLTATIPEMKSAVLSAQGLAEFPFNCAFTKPW
jgi:hypothetical protein